MPQYWDSYPRDELINDVIDVLARNGISVDLLNGRESERQRAASALLSSLSVIPTLAMEDALDFDGHARYNRLVHGD